MQHENRYVTLDAKKNTSKFVMKKQKNKHKNFSSFCISNSYFVKSKQT